MKPTVSILMNCYNCEQYLKEALDSIFSQTYTAWEVIFIDNQSIDSSADIAKSYGSKLLYYRTPHFMSLGAARNYGLQYCIHPYLAFLDTDDLWLPDKLSLQMELITQNPDMTLVFTGLHFVDAHGLKKRRFIPSVGNGYIFPKMLKHYQINMQTVLLRNNDDISFNESMQFSPDYDLFMHLLVNRDAGTIDKPLVHYRKLQNSLTNKKIGRWWIEQKMTLDSIKNKNPNLQNRYAQEFAYAYAKVDYYKARYEVSRGNILEAKKLMKNICFINHKFFMLHLVLQLSVNFWNRLHQWK